MNSKTRIAAVKTVVVLLVIVLGVLFPFDNALTLKITTLFAGVCFLLGIVFPAIMEYNSLRNHLVISQPYWTDALNDRKLFTFIQFIAFLMIAVGIGGIIGEFVQNRTTNSIGVVILATGIGSLIGMYITLWVNKGKKNNPK